MSENNLHSYIGITIGPIYPTLERIKSTRALFSGSYLFSWLMRELMAEIRGLGVSDQKILTPSARVPDKEHPEAGYYADRLILDAEELSLQTILQARDAVLRKMAAEIAADVRVSASSVEAYLMDYLQVYAIAIKLSPNESPFMELNRRLNGLELQRRFPDLDQTWLTTLLNQKKGNFLIEDAFGRKQGFPSMIEIATRELAQYDHNHYRRAISGELKPKQKQATAPIPVPEGEEVDIASDASSDERALAMLAESQEIRKHIKAYHKYVAVIHADGDGIGNYINGLGGNAADFRAFSDQLFEFSQKAREEIVEFGGAPIFIGGDDFLFLAPVAKRTPTGLNTVFHLVKRLDDLFVKYFKGSEKKPTLSYGIAFSYYKYPLNEARETSYTLAGKAKDVPGKNAVCFQLRKHSGAVTEAVFSKDADGKEFGMFLDLLGNLPDAKIFLSTLIHRLGYHEQTLRYLLEQADADRRVGFFLDNNFDEAVHATEKEFFKGLKAYLLELNRRDPETAMVRLNATLRFVHFLRSVEHDD